MQGTEERITKWEKFERRVINFSVATEDKIRTIDLLLEAIKSHQETSVSQIKGENAKFRVELNNVTLKKTKKTCQY